MAAQVPIGNVEEPLMGLYEKAYAGGCKLFKCCDECGQELYCSDTCKGLAWESYHSVLCVGRSESKEHPLCQYRELAMCVSIEVIISSPATRTHQRTNPLVI